MSDFTLGNKKLIDQGYKCCGRWKMCNMDGPHCAFMSAKKQYARSARLLREKAAQEGVKAGEVPAVEGHLVRCSCIACIVARQSHE